MDMVRKGVCDDCVEEKKWVVKHLQWKGVIEIEFISIKEEGGIKSHRKK